jgi:hypothetical protein
VSVSCNTEWHTFTHTHTNPHTHKHTNAPTHTNQDKSTNIQTHPHTSHTSHTPKHPPVHTHPHQYIPTTVPSVHNSKPHQPTSWPQTRTDQLTQHTLSNFLSHNTHCQSHTLNILMFPLTISYQSLPLPMTTLQLNHSLLTNQYNYQ